MRWCGIRSRSSGDGFALPMSIPRYTVNASAVTSSAFSFPASSKAAALLPTPVGPTTATTGSDADRSAASGTRQDLPRVRLHADWCTDQVIRGSFFQPDIDQIPWIQAVESLEMHQSLGPRPAGESLVVSLAHALDQNPLHRSHLPFVGLTREVARQRGEALV